MGTCLETSLEFFTRLRSPLQLLRFCRVNPLVYPSILVSPTNKSLCQSHKQILMSVLQTNPYVSPTNKSLCQSYKQILMSVLQTNSYVSPTNKSLCQSHKQILMSVLQTNPYVSPTNKSLCQSYKQILMSVLQTNPYVWHTNVFIKAAAAKTRRKMGSLGEIIRVLLTFVQEFRIRRC